MGSEVTEHSVIHYQKTQVLYGKPEDFLVKFIAAPKHLRVIWLHGALNAEGRQEAHTELRIVQKPP